MSVVAATSLVNAAPVLQPPMLQSFIAATYPDTAVDKTIAVVVDLDLIVERDGTVSTVTIARSGGDAFDAAALAAVRRFVFQPATKDGVTIRARIRYRYTFEPPPTPSPSVDAPAPAASPSASPAETPLDHYGAMAQVDAVATEFTERRIDAEDQTRVAGTHGDVLRAVELLPGVARPPEMSGSVIVRGSAPWDSEVSFEGASAAKLYHFGGLTSFVNGELLDGIELYSGNFSVRYGRRLGSIIRADMRDPRTDRTRVVVNASSIDSSALIEGPATKTLSYAIAARRSYIDAVFETLVGDSIGVVQAPVYWDYQAMLVARPRPSERVRMLAYGFGDALMLTSEPSTGDPAVRGRQGMSNYAHRLQLDWRRSWSPAVEHDVSVTGGTLDQSADVGPTIGYTADGFDVYGRAELRWSVSPRLRLVGGFDLALVQVNIHYQGPGLSQVEGDPHVNDPLSEQGMFAIDRTARWFRPAAYLETTVRPVRELAVTTGLRADYTSEERATSIDPRATAQYAIGRTRLKAGVGRFSEPPEFQTILRVPGHALGFEHALHYGLGFDRELDARASIGVEGFYKDLRNMIVGGLDRTMLSNAGVGRIYGLELSAQLRPAGPVSGMLSYTLSRSERNDERGDGWRLFDFDQTHILTASAMWRISDRWIAGGTFRFVSGNPETPVTGSVYDADRDLYLPVYGAVNSSRNPAFHRLDLRIERDFRWLGGLWAGTFELQNAYNHANREGTRYSFDYAVREDIKGLPLLPSVALRASF